MHSDDEIGQKLLSILCERRYRGRMVSARHLEELQKGIETHYHDGQFDEEFHQIRLSGFCYSPPNEFPHPCTLIIVAVPRPQTEAVFNWHNQRFPLIIPPTYTDYRKVAQHVASLLAGFLEPYGYQTVLASLPLKLLAVCSGLAAYGRNNISYIPGLGSFFELVGLYTDLPCPVDEWYAPRMMEACGNCLACLRRCPTGAITEQRFLLHAERCIVFHGERPGDIPFPAWIDPGWHNCLEGCMHCQRVCPENKHVLKWVEGSEEFSESETALLLHGASPDDLPADTYDKLARLDLLDDLDILPRNLGVFLKLDM